MPLGGYAKPQVGSGIAELVGLVDDAVLMVLELDNDADEVTEATSLEVLRVCDELESSDTDVDEVNPLNNAEELASLEAGKDEVAEDSKDVMLGSCEDVEE